MTQWIRYRIEWGYGSDEWQYTQVPERYAKSNELIRTWLEAIKIPSHYEYSDSYRGYKWNRIKAPPIEFVENQIKNLTTAIKGMNLALKEMKQLKKELNHDTISNR